jgi:predicted nuclease of predicted toxin-antitoxin system
VRVLLDENLPHDLAAALTGHAVSTVQGLGLAGTKNGALLKRAGDVCDVLVTMDANIERQQKLASLPFGIVVIRAPSNRMNDLLPIVPELLQIVETVRPGEATHIGRSPARRDESDQRV